ncbi:TolC family protein [Microbulbifer harenosus]|uniref:TolC family protein n=1 Tax=Microbulbifer harenosus TaxID=2576840 RepID=A0ABY2UEQ0_9GAMM|nr:TolC family protein [Microbulbifer harenosus]TLM73996.1 TolC family protein [Microbulbifer harenosus]
MCISVAPRPGGKTLRACLIGGALFFGSSLVAAAGPHTPAPALTLGEAVARTLERHPSLAVFEFRQRVQDGRAATAALRPALNLDLELENAAGTNGADDAELTVGISSVVELGGKRGARGEVINAERRLLDADRQVQAMDLLGEVLRRYVRVLSTTELAALAESSVRLALDAVNGVEDRVAAGGAPQMELLRARAALARAQLALQRSQQQLEAERVALAAMWGETSAAFSVTGGELYRPGPAGDFEEYFARARQSPLLSRFASEARLNAAQLRLARSEASADLAWALGVRRSRETDSTSLVAGLSIPLWRGERARGGIDAAQAQFDGIAVRQRSAELNLHTQLYRAFNNRAQSIAAVHRLQTEIIPALSGALEESERYYLAGRYGYQEWVAAREELLDARRALIDEATAALLAGAEIEQLTAAPLITGSALRAEKQFGKNHEQ